MTTQTYFCYRCGTPLADGSHFCPECGAASLTNRDTSGPAALLISLAAVAIAVAAVYFLVTRGNSDGTSAVGEEVTLEDLQLTAPPGWKSLYDEPDRYTFALTEKDLTAPLPIGPRITISREEKASVNFPAKVTEDIDTDDIRDRIKNGARYGVAGQLTGSEIRFIRKTDGVADYVERHLYLRGPDVFGPAFDIIFLVLADDEDLYNYLFDDLLATLELHTAE